MVNDRGVVVAPDRVAVGFDDERLVADAGIVLPAALAGRLGVEALVEGAVDLGARVGGARAGAKVMTLGSAMALGADSIDDCDILRSGSTATVLGHRALAPSTLGTFLRAFSFAHVRQVDRVLGRAIERAWRAGAGPGASRLIVDVDSFVGEVHGYQKQGASFGHTRERGYHPLLAARADTGEVLHIRLRKGSANTQRGALRFIEELVARVSRAGASGEKLLRADSGFWNRKVFERLPRAGWRYSVGVTIQPHVRAAIEAIPESAWRTLSDYPDTSEAQIAETQLGEDRLVVRRVRTLDAQGELLPSSRHYPFVTTCVSGSFRLGRPVAWAGAATRLPADDHGVPEALRHRGGVPRLPVRLALAGGLPLPRLRLGRGRRDAPPTARLAVQALRPPDLGDRGNGDARHSHVAADLVLGRLPGRHPPSRDLGQAASAPARTLPLRDHLADPAKDQAGDGRAEREPLKREVEVDEFFLGGVEKGTHGARQRGEKALCGIAIEVRGQGSGRLRLGVLRDASGRSLGGFLKGTTAPGAIVHTDGWRGYAGLRQLGYDHRPRSQRAEPGERLLPRAHRAVSNLKAWMHGTHRGVSNDHLPVYLDEFVFRHNRRRTPMAAFQTLLGLGALHEPSTYREITRRAA
jgi:transposase-like protein